MEKKDKYDTNPLDPDYVRQTENIWGATRGTPDTDEIGGATRDVARTPNEQARQNIDAEAPTRRYDTSPPSSYPSIFVPPTYQHPTTSYGAATPPDAPPAPPAPTRTVPGINVPEKVAAILPYIPFYVGAILGAIELFLVPRNEVRTRFHAAQGVALHLFVLAVGFLISSAQTLASSTLGSFAAAVLSIIAAMFTFASLIFFIISMIRVWKGEEHRLTPLEDATRWLNEHIEPRK